MKYIRLIVILATTLILLECGDDKSSGPSIPDPIASFNQSGGTVSPAEIAFQNTSQNADTYIWRFGDGDSTIITDPTHTYNVYGNYTVTLTATSSRTGRSSTHSELIRISPGSVFFDVVQIDQMPFTDHYGDGWDPDSGPDLYWNIVDSDQNRLLPPNYYSDVEPADLPVSWDVYPDIPVEDWSMVYYVDIWDYDGPGGNDYIGATNSFSINNVIASIGYADGVTLRDNPGTIRATIMLRWQ